MEDRKEGRDDVSNTAGKLYGMKLYRQREAVKLTLDRIEMDKRWKRDKAIGSFDSGLR